MYRRENRKRSAAKTASRSAGFWVWLVVMAALGFFASRGAVAQSVDCTGSAQTIRVAMPASITIPRDAANGTILTSWVFTPATSNYYSCEVTTTRSVQPASGMAFQLVSMTTAGLSVKGPSGVAYTVWNTNVPGIGIAIGVRAYTNVCGWQPWLDTAPAAKWHGNVCTGSTPPIVNGGQVQVALVKTGDITAGTFSGDVLLNGVATVDMDNKGPHRYGNAGSISFSLSPTIINVAACTTPNVTVTMNSYKQSSFTAVGATTPAVAFNVAVNACPTGLNSIQYQFTPVNAVLDTANGVLALSNDSTAAGIGLQLKDNGGKALKYNTQYSLTDYNSSTGGSYTIPLTANYYQTSAKVTPGSANAQLTFTMTYQ